MTNPAEPITYVNRLKASGALEQIFIESPLAFKDSANMLVPVGPYVQRQYLNADDTLTIGNGECLLMTGRFRLDGRITALGTGYVHVF